MTGRDSSRRRQFLAGLAAVGSASLAGCSLVSNDDTGPTFTAADAGTVITDPAPAIEWPVPVVPDSEAVDDALERTDALLADVPDPLAEETVPNGVVRSEIATRRDDARDYREEAAGATGEERYHALRTTREARDAARTAATTLAAIDDGTLVAALREERDAVRSRIDDQRASIAYRGTDTDDERLRAALCYARLESDLGRAADRVDRPRWSVDAGSNVIEIGTGAGSLEFATATAAAWDHLAERHEARTDGSDLTPVFDAALEASAERLEAADVPDPNDDDWLSAVFGEEPDEPRLEQTLWQTVDSVSGTMDRLNEAIEEGNRGLGLHEAVRFEVRYRGFERVRDRIEDGTLSAPDSIDEIRAERTAAMEAAASARESLSDPSIGAYVLAETLREFEWTDERVRRAADNDPDVVVTLAREHGDYARLRTHLEVLPDAVAAFRQRLFAA